MEVIVKAFRATGTAVGDRINVFLIAALGLALAGLVFNLTVVAGPGEKARVTFAAWEALFVEVPVFLGALASPFAFEGAIRTARPSFALRVSTIAMLVALYVIRLVAVQIGCIVLVVPGIIVATRLFPVLALYGLDEDRGFSALTESWALTSHHFWSTLGIMVTATLVAFVPFFFVDVVVGAMETLVPPLVIVGAPIVFFASVVGFAFLDCVTVELALALRADAAYRDRNFLPA